MIVNDSLLERTVSNIFMVPLLKIGRGTLDSHDFINSFQYNAEEFVVYEGVLHLLFQPPHIDRFNQFVDDEKARTAAFVCRLDYPNNLVILVYQLPPRFKKDYEKIWNGKFSEVSESYKAAIPAIGNRLLEDGDKVISEVTLQHMVFNKMEVLKNIWEQRFDVVMDHDQELWTIPTIERETFKFKDYENFTKRKSKPFTANASRVKRP